MNKQIQVIIGPTASGKSSYSIELAKRHNAEIISADAFQIYKDFNIGTAKLSIDEMCSIKHHLISEFSPESPYSVKQFIDNVSERVSTIQSDKKSVIICGGSAMYLRALLYGYSPLKRLPTTERPNGTNEELWNQLFKIDPPLANKTPKQNKQRVQRYLELFKIYKRPPSELFQSTKQISDKYKVIGISIEKDKLKEKINSRVEIMISEGLVDEVIQLMKKYNHNSPAFKAIGYKEVLQFLEGKITKETMINLIKKNTIQYAKKQMTWFKAFENVTWINQ